MHCTDMASSGYYCYHSPYHYQPAPCYYSYSPQQPARGGWQPSSVPVFLLLAMTASLLVAAALVAWCESAVESLVHQLRGLLILSPVLVVVAVQLWVASGGGGGGLVSLLAELVTGDRREQHYYRYRCRGGGGGGAGSSPWGVALALALVLFLVSYQSSIHWRWFGR